jgi:hypothetical protein
MADRSAELRGECPREILDVLDAISTARDMTRTQLVNEVLGNWARQVRHEHMIVARVCGVIPAESDTAGEHRPLRGLGQ